MLNQISKRYPECTTIKVVFGISKSKVLNDIVGLLEADEKVSDLFIVSRPHMRLQKADVAHKIVGEIGSQKLRDVIMESAEVVTKESETNSDSS